MARSSDNLETIDSLEVTFELDFTLSRPDNQEGSRDFNVGPGTLTSLAVFQTSLTGFPSGMDLVRMTINFSSTTGDVTAPFTFTTTAGAEVGVHMVQVTYTFLDATDTVLASHTLDFTIEVLP